MMDVSVNSAASTKVNSLSNESISTSSLQLMFAALQMDLAKDSRDKAVDKINGIKENQKQAKACATLLENISKFSSTDDGDSTKTNRAKHVKQFEQMAKELGITGDWFSQSKLSNAEVQSLKTVIQGKQEQFGSETQTTMIFVQDFIGKYNSYTQGANTAIANANQVTTSIAKGQ